jgi:hypothetical protein
MNSAELLRKKQKAAPMYVSRHVVTDSSVQTWKQQTRSAFADAGIMPAIVPTIESKAASGVMAFAGIDPRLESCGAYQKVSQGKGMNGEGLGRILANAGGANCGDKDMTAPLEGFTVNSGFTYETRQRFAITDAAGNILNQNTLIPITECGTSQTPRWGVKGAGVDCTGSSVPIYAAGGIPAYTTKKDKLYRL